jgi:hypothetical protein
MATQAIVEALAAGTAVPGLAGKALLGHVLQRRRGELVVGP